MFHRFPIRSRLALAAAGLALTMAATMAARPAPAQQPAPAVDPAAVEAARQLFSTMGADTQFDTVIATMTSGLASVVKQQHPTRAKDIDEVFAKLADRFRSRKGEIVTMVAPLWAEKFTVAELGEITAFFKTAIGQKLVREQPGIMQRSMQLGMAWGQAIGQQVEAEARRELKERGIDL